jgi:energy-coupling factor transporter ATP-binding protein EcfA2
MSKNVTEVLQEIEDRHNPEKVRERLLTIYEEIKVIVAEFLDMNPDYYSIVALWIMGTYIHSMFSAYPFLYINAQRGSGKTRLLKIISQLAYKANGQVQTGLTEAVLFRSEKGATLILDECESIATKEKAALREYLNASYKKGATVKRSRKVKQKDGENYEVESFEPYRPIALANIEGIDSVLGDRCLTLILEKSKNEIKTRLIENFEDDPRFFRIKRELYELNELWCSLCKLVYTQNIVNEWNNYIRDTITTLTTHTTYTTLTTLTTPTKQYPLLFYELEKLKINGRNLELIMPLCLIGNSFSEKVMLDNLTVLQKIIEVKQEDEFNEDFDVSLLSYVSTLEQYRFNYINVNTLTSKFRDYMGEIDTPYSWLNSKWVGRALKRLNLYTDKRRVSKGTEVILAVDRAKEKRLIYRNTDNSEVKK